MAHEDVLCRVGGEGNGVEEDFDTLEAIIEMPRLDLEGFDGSNYEKRIILWRYPLFNPPPLHIFLEVEELEVKSERETHSNIISIKTNGLEEEWIP